MTAAALSAVRAPEGLLLIDKPSGPTSHDMVEVVRRKLVLRRIGHTGTLDPMARGLLILLVGAATRHQARFQGHEKSYEAVLQLGLQTETGDATGTVVRQQSVLPFDDRGLADVLAGLHGSLPQRPPAYSAVKVRGRPSYWWARRRQPVILTPRLVQIHELVLLKREASQLTFRVRCSAGTYVRVLGESIAERLGTVGHLTSLVRLQIAEWRLEQAVSLAWIREARPEAVVQALHPVPDQPFAPPATSPLSRPDCSLPSCAC